MFSKSNVKYLLGLFVWANLVNLIFFVLRLSGVAMIRPIVVYEYWLIPLLIACSVPMLVTYLYFVVVLVIDLIDQVSFIFLFDVPGFIKNLKFYSLYRFSAVHYLLLLAFIAFLGLTFFVLKRLKLPEQSMRSMVVGVTVSIFIIFYSVDSLGGRTLLNEKKSFLNFDYNLGAAISKDIYAIVKDQMDRPATVTPKGESATFREFRNDTTGNQLLIIMESWGLPVDERAWNKIRMAVGEQTKSTDWSVEFGSNKICRKHCQCRVDATVEFSG